MAKKLHLLIFLILISLTAGATIKIVTSINVVEDWLKVIGQDKVTVHTLITGLETPHTYSPKPSDTLSINQADCFIGIGLGLESWIDSLIKSAAQRNLAIYFLSQGPEKISSVSKAPLHTQNDHENPHIWLSLEKARIMAGHIADILSLLDTENSSFYQENATGYKKELSNLQNKYQQKFSLLGSLRVVSFPASYPYLLTEMGIEEVARGEETHGQEPSAKKMIALADLMKKTAVKILIAEKQFASPLPDSLAKETGAEVVFLSPLIIGNQSYLDLMEDNYLALYNAFLKYN